MINIEDKYKCVGCYGCASVCPVGCIELKSDMEGFYYPTVDCSKCIDCGLCERVCPVLHQGYVRKPLHTYAAINNDEQIRVKSSSGGIFSLLAEKILLVGGVVFGAVFNENWEVVHSVACNSEELASMRGSKYVQSQIGECYKRCKKYLNDGKDVLFTGTPCQIAGLRCYLQEEYDNLICVDIICHGVPSPAVFKAYLTEDANKLGVDYNSLRSFYFRNKNEGWRNFSISRSYNIKNEIKNLIEKSSKNLFIRGFIKDIFLRPSCYACPSKEFKSGSDITIADFWGIENVEPEFDDNKGTSLVCINSEKGSRLFDFISNKMKWKEVLASDAFKSNCCVSRSVAEPKERKLFFELFETMNVHRIIEKLTKPSFKEIVVFCLKRLKLFVLIQSIFRYFKI